MGGCFPARTQLFNRNNVINVKTVLGDEISRVKVVFVPNPENAKAEVP
jgi:hypothetical protein